METVIIKSFQSIDLSIYKMPIITIYNSPLDFPTKFVARIWNLDQPTEYAMVEDHLETIKESIPQYMMYWPRNPYDEPHIICSYF